MRAALVGRTGEAGRTVWGTELCHYQKCSSLPGYIQPFVFMCLVSFWSKDQKRLNGFGRHLQSLVVQKKNRPINKYKYVVENEEYHEWLRIMVLWASSEWASQIIPFKVFLFYCFIIKVFLLLVSHQNINTIINPGLLTIFSSLVS